MINPDRLTVKSGEALNEAQAEARRLGNPMIYDTHLLHVLLGQEESIVVPVLQKLGASVTAIRAQVDRELARYPKQSGDGVGAAAGRKAHQDPDGRAAALGTCQARQRRQGTQGQGPGQNATS